MAEKALRTVSVGVNGTTYTREVEPRDLLVYFLREELGLTGNARRLRHQPVRRMHHPHRQSARQVVHAVRRPGGRAPVDHRRRPGPGRQAAALAGSLLERARLAVRLLHAWLPDDRDRLAAEQSEPDRRADPQGFGRQPVSLHRLREHRQGRAGGERIDRGGYACAGRRPSQREGIGHGYQPDDWRQNPSARRSAPDHRQRTVHRGPGPPGHADDGGRAQPARPRAHHPHRHHRRESHAWRGRRADVRRLQAAADWHAPRRAWRSSPRNTPSRSGFRWPIRRWPSRASRSRSCLPKTANWPSTRPRRSRSTTSRCRRSPTSSRASRPTVPKCTPTCPTTSAGTSPCPRGYGQGRLRPGRGRRQRAHPAAAAGADGDRDARRRRRVQPVRRSTDHLARDPEPALHPPVRVRRAGHARDEGAGHFARRRRRLRQQDQPVPRGLSGACRGQVAQTAGALDRDPHREPADHDPRSRPGLRPRAGRQARRDAAGAEGHPVPGHGRVHRHVRRVPDVRVPAGGRRLQVAGRHRGAHDWRAHQSRAD